MPGEGEGGRTGFQGSTLSVICQRSVLHAPIETGSPSAGLHMSANLVRQHPEASPPRWGRNAGQNNLYPSTQLILAPYYRSAAGNTPLPPARLYLLYRLAPIDGALWLCAFVFLFLVCFVRAAPEGEKHGSPHREANRGD